jgi:50S ribosomal subunit-associated GTPase HflX
LWQTVTFGPGGIVVVVELVVVGVLVVAVVEEGVELVVVVLAVVVVADEVVVVGSVVVDLLPWLAAREVPVLGAATKVDRLSARERAAHLAALASAGLPIEWIPTSGRTGEGVETLWEPIDAALAEASSRCMAP